MKRANIQEGYTDDRRNHPSGAGGLRGIRHPKTCRQAVYIRNQRAGTGCPCLPGAVCPYRLRGRELSAPPDFDMRRGGRQPAPGLSGKGAGHAVAEYTRTRRHARCAGDARERFPPVRHRGTPGLCRRRHRCAAPAAGDEGRKGARRGACRNPGFPQQIHGDP